MALPAVRSGQNFATTGAAAGFEFAADERYRDEVFERFAQILEERHLSSGGIPITHRYLAAVGQKQ